jgi:tetratricopeptide (TPR) repeat protein
MGECGRFECARFRRQIGAFIAVLLAAATCSWAFCAENDAKAPEKPPVTALPPIVCLHTEFLPYRDTETLRYRLMRELGRQALLIAARDELGLATRDETLGEAFPESVTQAKQDVFVSVRNQFDGTVRYQLWLTDKPEKILPAKKEKPHDPNVILSLTEKLEPQIRGELRDKLRALGFEGKGVATNEKNHPTDAVEGQLLEMNFVSQFAAVRAAHEAIADKGPSRGWLSVLARGYANLSLMTEHHWKSDTEAFAARALLYAERLLVANPNDAAAHATRAYVRAIVGLHAAALEDQKLAEDLHKKHADEKDLPGWFDVINPYCSFDRGSLHSLGERRRSLRQLTRRLGFEHARAFGDDRWMYEASKETMNDCPEEYSVYNYLADCSGTLLAVVRTGANYAPVALAHFLPARIASLKDAPPIEETDDEKPKSDKPDDSQATMKRGAYAAATIPIVKALRTATQSGSDKGEPTWSALGELIFEEQFVQATAYLRVSLNATETSHNEEVKSTLPAIKGHHFERYIRTFADSVRNDQAEIEKIIGDMRIADPRVNMQPMLNELWNVKTPGNKWGRGANSSWWAYIDRSMTFSGLLESYQQGNGWERADAEMKKEIAEDFQKISPHSPQALRLAIMVEENPSFEKLTQWESEAGDDPTAYIWLGNHFANLKHYDDAIRVYERSIKLSPSKDAYVNLANTQYSAGHEELWQPTLERFFEVESLGLEHAAVHELIANYLMDRNRYEEARPHAVAAAETWSTFGLLLASRVDEALGRWDDSEKWIREASRSYPSYAGDEWYYWCRRTGRGDLKAAREFTQSFFNAERTKTYLDGRHKSMTYHVLEGDSRAALEDVEAAVLLGEGQHSKDDDKVYDQVHRALLARELKNEETASAAIKEIRQLSTNFREQYPEFSAVNMAVCDILDGKTISDDADTKLGDSLDKATNKLTRCNYQYFLGRAYDLAGNKERAEKYWKQCVTRGPFDRYNTTLAGKYLADRNKTSRP